MARGPSGYCSGVRAYNAIIIYQRTKMESYHLRFKRFVLARTFRVQKLIPLFHAFLGFFQKILILLLLQQSKQSP